MCLFNTLPLPLPLLFHCWAPNSYVSFVMSHKHIPVNKVIEWAGNEVADSCLDQYIHVHDLLQKFNDDVIKNCSWLRKPWYETCPYLKNSRFGHRVENPSGDILEKCWFQTNQFVLEILFHNRMKNYRCLTNDSSLASTIFVPFYAGLDVGRYIWTHNASTRDALGLDLVKWVAERPEWKRMWGRDHFFVPGRIAWDFHRRSDTDSYWGSKLLNLPEAMNMTILSIESTSRGNEFALPYPTHFHPSSEIEILRWQNRIRKQERQYLFSFAGAP
uniref:Xyloglucan galactosyltransferase n=1 Tax=Rhizophora mucronata TaxID=61149 RepID=A0A2P2K319_RHIMU